MSNPVIGILLAAGKGTRFGGDKCLALLPDGTPLGLKSAQNLAGAGAVSRVLCVVRPEDDELRALFHEYGFETVDCADADLGMSSSLKAGINAAPDAMGWVIALADMPFIQTATHQSVADQLLKATLGTNHPRTLEKQGRIVVPQYAEKYGHPVGFSHSYRQDLLGLSGDTGARSLLSRYPDDVSVLSVDDPAIHQDIDSQQDLLELIIK